MASRKAMRGILPAAVVLAVASVAGAQVGPDVIVGEIPDSTTNGGGSYAVGTTSCNIGTAPLTWNSGTPAHPVISQNIYRLMTVNGAPRFEQIGQAWLKHGFCALQGTVCNSACPGTGGCGALEPTCSDPYSSGLNNSLTGAKSVVNASTGAFPTSGTGSGTAIRLHAATADLGLSGASYFVSSMYVQPEDAANHNNNNNESYRTCTIGAASPWTMGLTGTTQRMKPGLQAWKDADASVTITNVDVASDGRFIIASKATLISGTTYRYEYAVQNLNSDRSGQGFTVTVPAGSVVTNVGFHDVDYTAEGYSLTDWTMPANQTYVSATDLVWFSQTFAQNANANALRWDTIYNFRFDCNVAPGTGGGTITLFKAGSPATVAGLAIVPGGGPIPPPGNDNCANALAIGAGATGFDTTAATTDGPVETTLCTNAGDSQVGADIWFKYTAATGGSTTVSTCGSGFDTKLTIYPNATCPSAPNTALACNDDSATCGAGSLQSLLSFTAVQNSTYLIRVGGYTPTAGTPAFGSGTLTITPPGPVAPPNDNCANAIVISYPSSTAFSNVLSTNDGPTPTTCGSGNLVGADIWYKFTACASGTITASLCGATYDSVLAIYTNVCPATNATQLACNDDSCALQSNLTFSAVNGTTYLVRIGGYQSATGSGTMVLSGPSCPVIPANNDCANRAGIGLGPTPINTANATTDGPTTAACGQLGQDIWYNHPATCTGRLTVTMCNNASTYDSMLAVYEDAGCTNLASRLMLCNNDGAGAGCTGGRAEVAFNIVSGRNYTVRVGGVGAATGTGTMTLSCVAHCRGDWNGDGVITPADVSAFVNDWFASLTAGTLLADYNDDLAMTPADVAAFVSQWFVDLSGVCT